MKICLVLRAGRVWLHHRQVGPEIEAEGRPGDMAELAALLGKLGQIELELEQIERAGRWRLREGEPSQ